MSYDKNGNITSLLRNGSNDSSSALNLIKIDELIYTYPTNSNQLAKVYDSSTNPNGFLDGINTNDDYSYDLNGNMIVDQNKKITSITYNHLNLPTKISINGKEINYIYEAIGTKLKKTVPDNSTGSIIMISNDYLSGGFQYKNNALQFFPHPDGYVNLTYPEERGAAPVYSYVYNYTDHLGNVRMSYAKDAITNVLIILEENHYYPFGLKHNGYNSDNYDFTYYKISKQTRIKPEPPLIVSSYQRKYNGKELQSELGLNLYDFGNRNYDASIGRFFNVDPLAEKFAGRSPYEYCFSNPVNLVDPSGMSPTPNWSAFISNLNALIANAKKIFGQKGFRVIAVA